MGFFSSRKAEPVALPSNISYLVPAVDDQEKSVVQIIRSRFYGKGKDEKGKRLLQNRRPSNHTPSITSSLVESSHNQSNSVTHRFESTRTSSDHLSPATSAHRPSADAITVTLAQRLNELAMANSEGLLDDDEYRLLRQDLFERFASSSVVPAETHLVKSTPAHTVRSVACASRHKSNFHLARTPSIQSQRSVASTLSGLFRRTKGFTKPPPKKDDDSVISSSSRISSTFPPSTRAMPIVRQSSDASLRTQGSRKAHDLRSISSRQTGKSTVAFADGRETLPNGTTRTSAKVAEPPPSSFFTRQLPHAVVDMAHLQTATDIHAEIQSTEAEARRLLEAFNGLELSTLTRLRTESPSTKLHHTRGDLPDSTWTLIPDRRSAREPDGLSVHSNRSKAQIPRRTSVHHQSPSLVKKPSVTSVSSQGRLQTIPTHIPLSHARFDSGAASPSDLSTNLARSTPHLPLSTLSKEPRTQTYGPPIFDISTSQERTQKSTTCSTYTVNSDGRFVDENDSSTDIIGDDCGSTTLHVEMEDIRRRRADVIHRYQQRLEYLQAKLKGAEMHERLLRK